MSAKPVDMLALQTQGHVGKDEQVGLRVIAADGTEEAKNNYKSSCF